MLTFTIERFVSAIAASMLLAGSSLAPLAAQSLAELARQEDERRKSIAQPAKVITNKDLAPAPVPAPAAPEPAPPAADAGKAAAKPGADAEAPKAPEPGAAPAVRDQAYWSGRVSALQVQLDRDQVYADALQTRVNALTTDFVNRDDPAQRDVIERDRQKALAELDRLKRAVEADRKALADVQEEARRAGVPPGWLR